MLTDIANWAAHSRPSEAMWNRKPNEKEVPRSSYNRLVECDAPILQVFALPASFRRGKGVRRIYKGFDKPN
jgi:hypothetical protein